MILPNPRVLDDLVRDRQRDLRVLSLRGPASAATRRWRVRLGHALIAAGSALSGERVQTARRCALSHRA